METIIPTISQEGGDTFALSIKLRDIELHTLVNQTLRPILTGEYSSYLRILNSIVDTIHEIRFTRFQEIRHISLSSFLYDLHSHLCIQESLVLQLLSEVGTCLNRAYTIKNDRRFTHGLQRAINPFRAITT